MAVILCDREIMSYPHTVLLQELAKSRALAREAPGSGEGQHRSICSGQTPPMEEPERASNQRAGLRDMGPTAVPG